MKSNTVINADITEILFESRNQEYGAYHLRKKYPDALFKSVIVICSVLLLMLFFHYQLTKTDLIPKMDPKPVNEGILTIMNLNEVELPEEESMAPKVEPRHQGMQKIKHKIPVPKKDAKADNTSANQDSLKQTDPGLKDENGKKDGSLGGDSLGTKKFVPRDTTPKKIVRIIEKDPDENFFPDQDPGELNMKAVKEMIHYPSRMKESEMEGSVVVRVLVNKNGKYKRHVVKMSSHPLFSKACEEHLSKLEFTPAIKDGKEVSAWITIPFKFRLYH